MIWPLSDNVIVSIISLIGGLIAAWFAGHVQRVMKRGDVVAAALNAQLGGWNTLAAQLHATIADLREELHTSEDKCGLDLKAVKDEMRSRDDDCKLRIAEIERRLSGPHNRHKG